MDGNVVSLRLMGCGRSRDAAEHSEWSSPHAREPTETTETSEQQQPRAPSWEPSPQELAQSLERLIQLRAANLEAETRALEQFHDRVSTFRKFLFNSRVEPAVFHEAGRCEHHGCGSKLRKFGRHHCRRCGRTLCGDHSQGRHAILGYGYTKPVRTCISCGEHLQRAQPLVALLDPKRDGAVELRDVEPGWTDHAVAHGLQTARADAIVIELLTQVQMVQQLQQCTAQFNETIEKQSAALAEVPGALMGDTAGSSGHEASSQRLDERSHAICAVCMEDPIEVCTCINMYRCVACHGVVLAGSVCTLRPCILL